ncbi:MAG: SPFH domain-containing protein [Anaerolineales bacterium]
MSDYDPNELDPISFWVLLLLSGGQHFTFHDLVKTMDRSKESVWDAIQNLQSKKYAKNANSKFMIDFAGVEYLTKRGILANEAEETPKPKDFKKKLKPPFFSNWTEMLIWLALPFSLLLIATILTIYFTYGYNYISPEKRMYQITTWIVVAGLLFFYFKLSYHHPMGSERIVVFQSGEAIGKKGPGRILLLPLIQHPKKVGLSERPLEIKKEPCLTRDKMLVTAGFYMTWEIEDPILSLTKVSNVEDSISSLTAAVLRSTIAEYEMNDAIEKQRSLNALIRTRIEHKATEWGVQVNNTELRELQPPDGVIKSIENRRKSENNIESLRQLIAVGSRMDARTFNLKYLETLEKIGEGKSTKYIIPMEFFNLLQDFIRGQNNNGANTAGNNGNGNNPPEQLPGGPIQ